MSGHSKWANIKNRKGAVDKKRSELFTKVSKNIMTAIRSRGGNSNPESNIVLREAIEKAREANMPKDNIDRLIKRFEERKANLVSVRYEGFGPHGVPLIIEAETDNSNRTISEIKTIFRDFGGNFGSEGTVAFMFERVGEFEIQRELTEEEQLKLIEAGVREFENNLIVVAVADMESLKSKLGELGIEHGEGQVVMRCKQKVWLKSEDEVNEVMDLIWSLEAHDDVVAVFSGFDLKK